MCRLCLISTFVWLPDQELLVKKVSKAMEARPTEWYLSTQHHIWQINTSRRFFSIASFAAQDVSLQTSSYGGIRFVAVANIVSRVFLDGDRVYGISKPNPVRGSISRIVLQRHGTLPPLSMYSNEKNMHILSTDTNHGSRGKIWFGMRNLCHPCPMMLKFHHLYSRLSFQDVTSVQRLHPLGKSTI